METPAHIRITVTADGSPTACLGESWESMHNEAGALSETRFIYAPAAKAVWDENWPAHFLSVGLGLGYNELLLAEMALARGDVSWRCLSYEADPALRSGFLAWVNGAPSALASTYEKIATSFGGENTRLELRKAQRDGRWQLQGALASDFEIAEPVHGILYDAFSRATSPELWSGSFLMDLFHRAAARECIFASYASTSVLKRVLLAAGFEVLPRRGFARKRESTFARRGAALPS